MNHRYEHQGKPCTRIPLQGAGYYTFLSITNHGKCKTDPAKALNLTREKFLYSGLFLLLLCIQSLFSQNVSIKGVASAFHGKEITLYSYSDLITYSLTKEAIDTVNDKGHFELKTTISETQCVLLKIGNLKGKMYIAPYFQYGVIFPIPDSNKFVSPNSEADVEINIVGDSTELNARIIDFNTQFDAFWEKNYKAFVAKKIHHQLDTFQIYCNKRYEKVKSKYFKTYVNYTFALINENTGRHHNYIASQYLLHEPIRYHHFEYMQFFNQYFTQYLQTRSITKSASTIINMINEKASYDELNATLKSDPLLHNDSLRELVILKNLFELYYVPKYNREKIKSIIRQLLMQTKNAEHQKIGQNIQTIFQSLQAGAVAPHFNLKDAFGREHALSDYQGKFVYLEFFASWNTACLQEMKKLEQLKHKFGDKIVFISISTDDSLKDFVQFCKNNPKFNWVLLHQGNSKIKELYNINATPAYFYISREGNFIYSPALRPSEGIELKFQQLFKPHTKH